VSNNSQFRNTAKGFKFNSRLTTNIEYKSPGPQNKYQSTENPNLLLIKGGDEEHKMMSKDQRIASILNQTNPMLVTHRRN
jgi:hypothetical protein